MYAIVETGGKQYKVSKGDFIYVEKLDVEEGTNVVLDKVLYVDGKIGTPYVEGASVEAKVVKHGKEKKIIVYKYKSKKNYHKKQGHRQPYTKLEIVDVK